MIFWVVLALVSFESIALDAVVTVLETPLLESPFYGSKIVQHLRKGDVIKVDPSLLNNTKFDHLGADEAKMKALREDIENSQEWRDEETFNYWPEASQDSFAFIPTLDRQGKKVWVRRGHLYIYYENRKELAQTVPSNDPTDYRLEEPLPRTYPLHHPTGYRGLFGLGFSQPYTESYPYNSNVKTKGYMAPIDLTIALLRITPNDNQDRFFFGGVFNVRYYNNEYALVSERHASEKGIRIGVGPYITYDAFKAEKNRINMYGSITVNFFNQIYVAQNDYIGNADERIYRSYNISPRLGVQYHRKKFLDDLDFVLGTGIEIEPTTTFRAKNGAEQPSWWQHGGNDKFKTRTTFTMVAFLGIQQAY